MARNDSVNIVLTGDFCPIGPIEDCCLADSSHNLYDLDLLKILREKDVSITNLECPLTYCSESIIKSGPKLKADPKCVETLSLASFDIVTLANNHIKDYGCKGVIDTLDICQHHAIMTVGAGRNVYEASEPLGINIKGLKIAIINCAENEFSSATIHDAGANPFDLIDISRQIIKAKSGNDIVLVIVHGGNERYALPSPRIVKTFRYFAEIGASAVIGHHSHYSSGYERYRNVPIFYGLGNFLFPAFKKEEIAWHKGYVLSMSVSLDCVIDFKLIPYLQCNNDIKITLMNACDRDVFLSEIKSLSETISDEEILNERWQQYCETNFKYYTNQIYNLNKLQKLIRNINLPLFKKNYIDRSYGLLNLFRCESHRDASISMLEDMISKNKG